jgi:competence protein ComEA
MPLAVSRSTALVALSVLLVVLALAGHRLAQAGTATAPSAEVVAPLEPVAQTPTRQPLVVHVVGAVRRPGLYRLRDGARVADAVARAGGATGGAELTALNLAAPLVDGVQILVPRRPAAAGAVETGGDVPSGLPLGSTTAATGGMGPKLSLSSATADQLDELPGVGPITAQKILDYRAEHGPFRSVDDLDAVPGIGPTRIEQLRDLVTP